MTNRTIRPLSRLAGILLAVSAAHCSANSLATAHVVSGPPRMSVSPATLSGELEHEQTFIIKGSWSPNAAARLEHCQLSCTSDLIDIVRVAPTDWHIVVTIRYITVGQAPVLFLLESLDSPGWTAHLSMLVTSMASCVDPTPNVLDNLLTDQGFALPRVDEGGDPIGNMTPHTPIGRALPVDVNHDGMRDILYAMAGGESVQLAFASEDGYAESLPASETGEPFRQVAEGAATFFLSDDEDYDTWEDAVVLHNSTSGTQLALYLNLEGDRFDEDAAKAVALSGHALALGTCDFNDDGVTDYVACHTDGTITVVLGGSTWTPVGVSLPAGTPVDAYDLASVYPNSSGVIVVTQDPSSILKVEPGSPTPTVTDITSSFSTLATTDKLIALYLFDHQADMRQDVLIVREVASDPDTTILADLFIQTSSGTFSPLNTTMLPLPVHWLRVTDTNNDGYADLVIATRVAQSGHPFSFKRAMGGSGGFGMPISIAPVDGLNYTTQTVAGSPAGIACGVGCISDLIRCGGWTDYAHITNTSTSAAAMKLCGMIDLIRDFGIYLVGVDHPCAATVRDIGTALKDAKAAGKLGTADFKNNNVDGWTNPLNKYVTIDEALVTAAIADGCDPDSDSFWELLTTLIHEGAHLEASPATSEGQATTDTIKVLAVMMEDIEKFCDGDPDTVSWLAAQLGLTWTGTGNTSSVLVRIRKQKWNQGWYHIQETGNWWVDLARAACRDQKDSGMRAAQVESKMTTKYPGLSFPSALSVTVTGNQCVVMICFGYCGYVGWWHETIKSRPC